MSAAARFNEVAQSKGWALICDERLAFDLPRMRDAYAYWSKVTGTRPMPKRTELSPAGMKTFLSIVSLAEMDRSDGRVRWRVRLQGSDMDRIVGPMTGHFIDEMIPSELLPRWTMPIQLVLDYWKPFRFVSEIQLPHREPGVMDSLLAPLSSNGTDFDMVFGVSGIRPHDSWAQFKETLATVQAG